MDDCHLSGDGVDVYAGVARVDDRPVTDLRDRITTENVHDLSKSQEYLDLVAQDFDGFS